MTLVPQGAILKVQTPEITVWASFFILCESGQIRHFWAQIFLIGNNLRQEKIFGCSSCRNIIDMRLSPRLDNFYEKIGVKTLGLLYPIVGRLQVPK